MSLLFVCADSRFGKPRISLKKVLIVAVRKSHCGALNRGLQNLDALCKGERVVTFCVVQKVTKKHTGRSPATHDSKLCRKWVCNNFRRLISKPVLPTKRRRKGFESVRKGDCTADARLRFFENEKVYCKLTVGCRRWNVWLLVSFVAVRSRCRCALKKVFSLSDNFAGAEKTPLSRIKKFH